MGPSQQQTGAETPVHSHMEVNGKICLERDALFDSAGLKRMHDSYMVKDVETSPQERFWYVSHAFADNIEHAHRLYEYASRHWLSFSSPLLSYHTETNKHALPISCYLIYASDTVKGLISTTAEASQLSVMGGGVSIKMAARGDTMAHIKQYDATMLAYKQTSRRGAFCVYMDIDHPEIEQFIDIRKSTGDDNLRAKNIHHAVNITDAFMELVLGSINDANFDDTWKLKNVKTGTVTSTVSARKLFAKIITTRLQTGEPFICFIDTCNRGMNAFQREKGFRIEQSNLCTEVIVPTNRDRSSMCCLASLNLVYYEDYQPIFTQLVEDVMRMLDNALTVFGEGIKENPFVQRMLGAVQGERNIGLGVMGFHSYLQYKGVALDDLERSLPINTRIFERLKCAADKANIKLGAERGEPLDIVGSGKRFAYTLAIAPTASTSIIMGNTSPSIDPFFANAYTQNTLSGLSELVKNVNLQRLLERKRLSPDDINMIWRDIITDEGSVQRISSDFLSDYEKRIFRKYDEVDMDALIILAANRQRYIDQGQSLSIHIRADDDDIGKIAAVHVKAWVLGCKTMYYCRSTKSARADNLNEHASSCQSCE